MPDWNHDGKQDAADLFITAKTYENSTKSCHCEEAGGRRGNPYPLSRIVGDILGVLFWIVLFFIVIFFC